jgi:hypothetical protein
MSLLAPVGKLVDDLRVNLILSIQETNEVGVGHCVALLVQVQ